ncbi:PALP-domain-containing protein [Cryphonectria parasitica EP155]|uniref:Cysteine synthase 2 n=1 Tax=Cryphonectria parasitica (strain ATCC 38755 / EP155) TaxID=660469 RepID=A0A9P4XWI6_CRYP1|nr:PALP-domain-containing protein [Cryphonectria parasitica EP155]KAF3762203.1 PALP-domain-containing protein [Cryphonectria parasitica EP155]
MTLSSHLSDHSRVYGTAALTITFLAGILVTLGFKDLYPDLERRYRSSTKKGSAAHTRASTNHPRRSSLFFGPPLQLEDHESDDGLVGDPASAGAPVVSEGIESTIGHTPLIRLKALSRLTGRTILAKAEFLNGCGGSPKDRVALSMILAAEKQGLLVPGRGDTIYEGTVGSTGISLATLARARGYRCHICMPADVAIEKSDLLRQLGAEVERVELAPITSPAHFVNLARRRAREHATLHRDDGSVGFFADQFESPANWGAHLHSTGPEIFAQTGGDIAAFVAGAGTGGTISGIARYLKEVAGLGDDVKVVLADPQGSGLYNKVKYGVMYSPTEKEGTRRRQQVDTIVEGIGITRITENFEAGRELIDDAVKVTDDQACRMARWLVENEGVFAGSSSAVNLVAAVVTAMKLPEGSQVVTILCDSGQRHLSKFYKRIADMGLEEQHESLDLFALLGIEKTGTSMTK